MLLEVLPDILIAAAESTKPIDDASTSARPSAMAWLLLGVAQVGVLVLFVGIVLCLWRMIKGPHLADRVLAGDTVAMLVAGLVVVLAIKYDSALFYDAALVVAILGFVSTVAFAQYIGAKHKSAPDHASTPSQQEDRA